MSKSGLKDDCICGHDRTHHYFDPATRTRHNCLAMHCDCVVFEEPASDSKRSVLRPVDQLDTAPDTPRTSFNKPHVDVHCRCAACVAWFWKSRGY